jgi:hypothetical protein
MRRPPARGGFTLVELAIGVVLMGVVGGVFMLTTETTTSAVRTGVAVADLDAGVLRSLERVCDALKSSSADLATPQAVAPFSGSSLDFQRCVGTDEVGAPVWGPLERIALEYDEANDGVDNDGDGLTDEGTLVWYEDPDGAGEKRIVLCPDVREYLEGEALDATDENENGLIDERGFALDFDGACVHVRLTLEGRDTKGLALLSTVERTIAFRNLGE